VGYARHIGDDAFESLVGELIAASPLFASLWAETTVHSPSEGRSVQLRDAAGEPLFFSGVSLAVPGDPELTVVLGLLGDD
jgi:hypothetical protein